MYRNTVSLSTTSTDEIIPDKKTISLLLYSNHYRVPYAA